MSLTLLGLGTAVPEHFASQHDAAAMVHATHCQTERQRSFVSELYLHAGIERRHSVVLEHSDGPLERRQTFFPPARDAEDRGPTTGERMQCYAATAPALAARAAREALAEAKIMTQDIAHLVTATCTGFVAPGTDVALITELGLPASVTRTQIGFMGCQAALNALRVGDALAGDSHVLIVCVELCSLHHQYSHAAERVVANALFADGAAAVVGTGSVQANVSWRLTASGSLVLPDSTSAMGWRIGDHGFEMNLSRELPAMLRSELHGWLEQWLQQQGQSIAQIRSWGVHPGGPKILSATAEGLGLARERLSASDAVLARYGNMSSPTVLFVLNELRRAGAELPCVALAFGPGLTIEAALFQ